MRIDQAKIEIRPRTAWEAIDLGILLGRHHLSLLMRTWFVVFFPIYLVLLYFLWEYPSWIAFVIWWLKPVFDRVPLYILSRSIFAPPPTVRETLVDWWKKLRFYLVGDLIFRRLSPVRSYLLPIYQLERSPRKLASKRTGDFLGADSKAGWLTFVFFHIESFLTLGILAFIYFMLPGYSLGSDFDPLDPFDFELEETFFWVFHLWSVLYFCVLSVTESLYVSCGFSLYLNRRIIHEGWDLELGFKRLLKRLSSALVLVVALSLVYMALPTPAHAAAVESPYHSQQSEAKKAINTLLDDPPFREVKEKRTLSRKDDSGKKLPDITMGNVDMGAASMLGNLMQVVIWGAVALVVALLIWYGKEMLPLFQQEKADKVPKKTIERFRGHEIMPETLPDDILAAFDKAWQQDRRQALGLLYRSLISQLVHDYQIPLKASHTENEVVRLTLQLNDKALIDLTQLTTKYWQYVAYGGYELSASDKDALILAWRVFLVRAEAKGGVA